MSRKRRSEQPSIARGKRDFLQLTGAAFASTALAGMPSVLRAQLMSHDSIIRMSVVEGINALKAGMYNRGVMSSAPRAVRLGVLVVAVGWILSPPAHATWSITAVDPQTRQVGIAVASCIGGADISVVGGLLPGVGVVAAQAMTNPDGRRFALELLNLGASPTQVIEKISAYDFDPQLLLSWTSGRETRQYAVVALGFEPTSAIFTGGRTIGWAGSLQSSGVSVQGNILRGAAVVTAALAAYESAAACALPDRLMRALEAGETAGGDRRCTRELSALSAYLEVAWPDDRPGESSLRIVVNHPEDTTSILRFFRQLLWPEQGGTKDSPLRSLREQFDRWRRQATDASEPCGISSPALQ